MALTTDQNLKLFSQLQQFTISFLIKITVNVVGPQELKMVYGESIEINGEKIVLCSTAEKNNCLRWIRSEKSCIVNLANVSYGPPIRMSNDTYNTEEFCL